MKDKNIIDLGLLLPLLTGLIFSAVYYYEYGYLSFYGLPSELIQVEIPNNSYLFFFCIILFIAIAGLMQPLFGLIVTLINTQGWVYRLILTAFMGVSIYFVLWDFLTSLYHFEIIYLIVTLILGSILALVKKTKDIQDLIYDDWSLIKYINYTLGHSLGPILIIGSLTCIFMFNLGNWNAKNVKIYLSKHDKNIILIRKYQSYDLYGITDSSSSKLNQVIIQKNLSDIDTLTVRKR